MEVIPNSKIYGTFITTTPSIPHRRIPNNKLVKKIKGIVPGEIVRAHLEYEQSVYKELINQDVLHFFIYRDPRDIVISEAMYLTYMNKWHSLHKYFRNLANDEQRIMLAINGLDAKSKYHYPNVVERFSSYLNWIESPSVISLKYEELTNSNLREVVMKRMAKVIIDKYSLSLSAESMVEKMTKSINPENSHTFRSGGTQKWKKYFNDDHTSAFQNCGGISLLNKMKYG